MSNIENWERELRDLDSPSPDQNPAPPRWKFPLKDKVTSVLGLGPVSPLQIFKVDAMVSEANRLGGLPGRQDLTHAETVTLAGRVKRAKTFLDKTAKGPVENKIASIKEMFGNINVIDNRLARIEEIRLLGPNGEQLAPSEARDSHDILRERVVRETDQGSKKHHIRRGGRGSKLKEILLVAIDLPVFVYAMFSLLNVDLRKVAAGDPLALVNGAVAFIFGLLGTVLFATIMRSMGHRHRRYKGADGSIETDTAAARKRLMVERIVALCIVVAVAFVMGARVFIEGAQAGAEMALVIPLSIMLGLLVGASGYINYQSEYENGSDETDRVSHLSAQLGAYTSLTESLHKERAVLLESAGKACATLIRMMIKAKEEARTMVASSTAANTVAIARSYANNTASVAIPEPKSDSFDNAERQANDLASHHRFLSNTEKKG